MTPRNQPELPTISHNDLQLATNTQNKVNLVPKMESTQKFTTFGTVVKSDVLTKELALLKKLELCIDLLKILILSCTFICVN